MSTQGSETQESLIGSVCFTLTGATGGQKILWRLLDDDWSPVTTNASEVLAGYEHQQDDIGGGSGTANRPVTIEFAGMPDTVYAGLRTQRDTAGAFYTGTLKLAATDGSGTERSLTFTRLRWLALTHDSAPDDVNRFAKRIYRRVRAELYSEA